MPRKHLVRQCASYDLITGASFGVSSQIVCLDIFGPQTYHNRDFGKNRRKGLSVRFSDNQLRDFPTTEKTEDEVTEQLEEAAACPPILKTIEPECGLEAGACGLQPGNAPPRESSGTLLLKEVEKRLDELMNVPVKIAVARNPNKRSPIEEDRLTDPLIWEYCSHRRSNRKPKEPPKKTDCPSHNYRMQNISSSKYRWVQDEKISIMIIESPISRNIKTVLQELVKHRVKTFVRVSSTDFEIDEILNAGIDVFDISFSSSCVPSATQMTAWLAVVRPISEDDKPILAVHGQGRAPFMVAIALMEMNFSFQTAVVTARGTYGCFFCLNQLRYLSKYKKKEGGAEDQPRLGTHISFA